MNYTDSSEIKNKMEILGDDAQEEPEAKPEISLEESKEETRPTTSIELSIPIRLDPAQRDRVPPREEPEPAGRSSLATSCSDVPPSATTWRSDIDDEAAPISPIEEVDPSQSIGSSDDFLLLSEDEEDSSLWMRSWAAA